MMNSEALWAAQNPNQAKKLGISVSSMFQGAGTPHPFINPALLKEPEYQDLINSPSYQAAREFYCAESDSSTLALTDKELGINVARAMDLLAAGADITAENRAAIRNAAQLDKSADILKLLLAVDPDFEATKKQVLAIADKKCSEAIDMLVNSAGAEATSTQKDFLKLFATAVAVRRREEASSLMHILVKTMFPRSPILKL